MRLRSALFPKVTAGDPQPLVDEARRLVKQRLARPRQVEALRREILSATGASISADVLTARPFSGVSESRAKLKASKLLAKHVLRRRIAALAALLQQRRAHVQPLQHLLDVGGDVRH